MPSMCPTDGWMGWMDGMEGDKNHPCSLVDLFLLQWSQDWGPEQHLECCTLWDIPGGIRVPSIPWFQRPSLLWLMELPTFLLHF